MLYRTIKEAAEAWVGRFNSYPVEMISQLMEVHPEYWYEITPPTAGNQVDVYSGEHTGAGEVVRCLPGENRYLIRMNDSKESYKIDINDFEVLYDETLPEWRTMWSFTDPVDKSWLEKKGSLQAMADLGFRIYENDEFGYFFGIDHSSNDTFKEYWIPLYKAMGLRWHEDDQEETA